MKKLTPISCNVEAVQILLSHLKTAITMRHGFHDLIAQQFSTIFSAGSHFLDNTK